MIFALAACSGPPLETAELERLNRANAAVKRATERTGVALEECVTDSYPTEEAAAVCFSRHLGDLEEPLAAALATYDAVLPAVADEECRSALARYRRGLADLAATVAEARELAASRRWDEVDAAFDDLEPLDAAARRAASRSCELDS